MNSLRKASCPEGDGPRNVEIVLTRGLLFDQLWTNLGKQWEELGMALDQFLSDFGMALINFK